MRHGIRAFLVTMMVWVLAAGVAMAQGKKKSGGGFFDEEDDTPPVRTTAATASTTAPTTTTTGTGTRTTTTTPTTSASAGPADSAAPSGACDIFGKKADGSCKSWDDVKHEIASEEAAKARLWNWGIWTGAMVILLGLVAYFVRYTRRWKRDQFEKLERMSGIFLKYDSRLDEHERVLRIVADRPDGRLPPPGGRAS